MFEPMNKQKCFLIKTTTVDKRNKERDNSRVYYVNEEIPCKLINAALGTVFEPNGNVKVRRVSLTGELEISMLDVSIGQGDKIKYDDELYLINKFDVIKTRNSLLKRKRYSIQATR